MANLTNSTISTLCTSTASSRYLKAQLVASNPTLQPALGNPGDYYFEDPSMYFKTNDGWVDFTAAAI